MNKIYLIDQGFRTFFVNSQSNYGHLIENLVYVELLRRGNNVQIGKMYDSEIDFICEKDGNRKYYQVSATVVDEKIMEREITPLLKVKDNNEKRIITLDELPMKKDGIEFTYALVYEIILDIVSNSNLKRTQKVHK